MKNLKLMGFLMLLASSLVFIQCTTDTVAGPQGIAGVDGADGADGINGLNGTNGQDGTASCVACHSQSHREPIEASFANSLHATGGAWARGSSASCAQCHGNEGYIDYVTNGAVNPDGYSGIISPMACITCHKKHSTFDFANDGHDYALRNFDPVTLVIDDATVIDFGGTSNNCATCHQPRNSYPVPAGTDDIEITSFRYGPHHGPQATMLEGIMGANIPGAVGYPGVGSATHRTGSSCVSCHMGASTDESKGLHSWNPTESACITCHTNGVPSEIGGYTADMAILKQLLIDKGILREDDYVVTGTFPSKLAQAVWNYRTLLEDNSHGIHNPAYARALLKNSIQAAQ